MNIILQYQLIYVLYILGKSFKWRDCEKEIFKTNCTFL